MSGLRVYVAGPMTGYPDFNYPAFFAAERALRNLGYDPINPARTEGREGCKTWLDFMRAALRDIADADAIATLPGWWDSRGASCEYRIGNDLGLPVFSLDEWLAAGGDLP